MNTTTLQVPINKSLKSAAQQEAQRLGFSSLQEAVRVFLTQLVKKTITINFTRQEPEEILTPRQEAVLNKKLKEALEDIKKGDYYVARSADEMIHQLRAKDD